MLYEGFYVLDILRVEAVNLLYKSNYGIIEL